MRHHSKVSVVVGLLLSFSGCAADGDEAPLDGENDTLSDGKADAWGIRSDSYLADAITKYASTASQTDLVSIGVNERAARAVVAATRPFASLDAVDAVKFTGQNFFNALATKVTADNLLGHCGDGMQQSAAGEVCDGEPTCSADCRVLGHMTSFVPTPRAVREMLWMGDDRVTVSLAKEDGTRFCTNKMMTVAGQTLFSVDNVCDWHSRWPGQNGFNLAILTEAPRVEEYDSRTGLEHDHYLKDQAIDCVYANDSITVMKGYGLRFLDTTTFEEIATSPGGGPQLVEADGSIVVSDALTNLVERVSLDSNDNLITTPLGLHMYSDGTTSRETEVRITPTATQIVRRMADTYTFVTFAPGNPMPVSSHTFGPYPGADFVASNGSYTTHEGNNHVVHDASGHVLATRTCDTHQAAGALAIETDSSIIISTSTCGQNGYFVVQK